MTKTSHFSIDILASKEHVWHTMLDDQTYREWTSVFGAGSYYEGSWEKGSKIRFLGTAETGAEQPSGMISEIAENKKYECISIRHLGYVVNGKDVTDTPEIQAWSPMLETYTFTALPLGTKLTVDVDMIPGMEEFMTEAWPKGLQQLKEMCQRPGPAVEVTAVVHAPLSHVWTCWTEPMHIAHWAFATPDWGVGKVENDVRVNGTFLTNMHAKDGSASFDFTGTYTEVIPEQKLTYRTDDSRMVTVEFSAEGDATRVTERFQTERVYPPEMQKEGWQQILNNFTQYAESAAN
jgi:uncharacterized protein YndB with AHSA1/START domain